MKLTVGLLSTILLLIGCDQPDKIDKIKPEIKDTVLINKSDFDVDQIPQGCYFQITDNDSVFITLDDNLGTITGYISYSKDSIVDIAGYASNDTLKLEAQFSISQDSIYTEEIWFLKEYGNLYEGIGKRKKDGTYLHPDFLKYDEKDSYKPIDCKDIEQ